MADEPQHPLVAGPPAQVAYQDLVVDSIEEVAGVFF
jgi:hypothetical protein